MQTQTTFGPEKIVKGPTSRAAQVRLMTIPYDTPVYLVCFGFMYGDEFRGVNVSSQIRATEGRAMKAAQKWVNA
jgi:hypothetical protein